MAKKQSQELGFLDGVHSQLIALIAGFVSFAVLSEKALNEIKSFFGVCEASAMKIFVSLYFLFPILFILVWLRWYNSNKGLKKYYSDGPDFNPLESRKFSKRLIFSIFILQATYIFIFCIDFSYSSSLSLWALVILSVACLTCIILYGVSLVWKNFKSLRQSLDDDGFHLLKQARGQFIFFGLIIIFFWLLHFGKSFRVSDLGFLKNQIDSAANAREIFRKFKIGLNSFNSSYPSFPHTDSISFHRLIGELKSEKYFSQIVSKDKISDTLYLETKNKINEISRLLASSVPHKDIQMRHNNLKNLIEEYFFSWIKVKNNLLANRYKENSAKWLNTVRYLGLMIFNLAILFLLCVWYDAYSLRLYHCRVEKEKQLTALKIKSEKDQKQCFHEDERNIKAASKRADSIFYSEINISRSSIYLFFLLTIPFFKPIEKDEVDFDKPYISFSVTSPFSPSEQQPFKTGFENDYQGILNEISTTLHKMEIIDSATSESVNSVSKIASKIQASDSSIDVTTHSIRDFSKIIKDSMQVLPNKLENVKKERKK